ncbi:MAG: hypothetical protein ABR505_12605, partial [Actinomycetota bacterium]
VVAQDGSISVSAHAGTTHLYKNPDALPGAEDFAVGYYNQTLNWRSDDSGKTWQYVGLMGSGNGPHSATSTGFSDPDFTMDAGGRIYNVEIDLANVAVFSSSDDGQSYPRANPIAASGDRPWVTGGEKDEVYLTVSSPQQLWRSNDGGLTYTLMSRQFPAGDKLLIDPLNPKTGLVGETAGGIAISEDDGVTWETYEPHNLGIFTSFFLVPAIDREGGIYAARAGGYSGPGDTVPNASVTFNYFDRVTKKWGKALKIPTPPGDALWPWLVAGDDGRVAVTWYQTLKNNPKKFYVYVAYSMNGHGTHVRCSDGSTRFVPPQFEVVNASGRPIHIGEICQGGVGCNTDVTEGGDRRLGDFFTINFDHTGRLFIVSGDTTLTHSLEGPKPVANPIFIKQIAGDLMLERPDKIRKTRPLCAGPNC